MMSTALGGEREAGRVRKLPVTYHRVWQQGTTSRKPGGHRAGETHPQPPEAEVHGQDMEACVLCLGIPPMTTESVTAQRQGHHPCALRCFVNNAANNSWGKEIHHRASFPLLRILPDSAPGRDSGHDPWEPGGEPGGCIAEDV